MEMQSYNIFSSRQLLVVRRVYGEYVVKTFVEKKAFFSDFGFNWIDQEVILYLLVVYCRVLLRSGCLLEIYYRVGWWVCLGLYFGVHKGSLGVCLWFIGSSLEVLLGSFEFYN